MGKIIDDLNKRLKNRRELVEPLEDAAWTYGMNTTYLKDVLEYWSTNYNWTERQALLNKYPQYITNIQGNKMFLFDCSLLNESRDCFAIIERLAPKQVLNERYRAH